MNNRRRKTVLLLLHTYWTNDAVYDLSDGYGLPGYVPPQGHDWSGVRDSSDEALEAMYYVAKRLNRQQKREERLSTLKALHRGWDRLVAKQLLIKKEQKK